MGRLLNPGLSNSGMQCKTTFFFCPPILAISNISANQNSGNSVGLSGTRLDRKSLGALIKQGFSRLSGTHRRKVHLPRNSLLSGTPRVRIAPGAPILLDFGSRELLSAASRQKRAFFFFRVSSAYGMGDNVSRSIIEFLAS